VACRIFQKVILQKYQVAIFHQKKIAMRPLSPEGIGVIKRHHPPVNILGGYKFPDAPVIGLRPPASPAASEPMPIVGDGLDIPEFLVRRPPHQNQMRKAA
jgi:hypothetical protein